MVFKGDGNNALWRIYETLWLKCFFYDKALQAKQQQKIKALQRLFFGHNDFGIALDMSNTNLLKLCLSEV